MSVRNKLMHFNMLRGKTRRLDMIGIVNDVRRLMSYDRKLKNAVSRSIIELMARENLTHIVGDGESFACTHENRFHEDQALG